MKHGFIKVAAATPSVRVSDCEYNTGKILLLIKRAAEKKVHLLVLPELCVTGYTCGDLFLQEELIENAEKSISVIAEHVPEDMVVVFGAPVRHKGKLHNCALVASAGKLLGITPKINIPNYKEFYEQRWFTPALKNEETVKIGKFTVVMNSKLIYTCRQMPSFRLACEVCEDLWVPNPPSVNHTINGATVIANLSASNEYADKSEYRYSLVTGQSARLACGYIYADAGEGESTTDLVYTGHDMICEAGVCLAHHSLKPDELLVTEIDLQKLEYERRMRNTFVTTNDKDYRFVDFDIRKTDTELTLNISPYPFLPHDSTLKSGYFEQILILQALGLKRRLEHVRAEKAIIGISGGLDSTLALIVTVKAFEMMKRPLSDILCITMPCFGTSDRTRSNAEKLADSLGCSFKTIDITDAVTAHFKDIDQDASKYDVTYENAQARERMQILMDLANKESGLVVGTGDLSELALGWTTFNGDHMSNYSVNCGVPKTLVHALVRYTGETTDDKALSDVLFSICDTPISPELIPGKQETESAIGPYILHDFFMYYFLRWGFSSEKILRLAVYVFKGVYSTDKIRETLNTFFRRFYSQQFKRNCIPDGPKVGLLSLSPRGDWRMPSDAVLKNLS